MDKEKLRLLIKNSQKSINSIQEETGMKSGALYRLLSGEREDVLLSTAFKLADVLGIDVNEFSEVLK